MTDNGMDENESEPPLANGHEPVLGWHRVCLNTIVRATKDLESARLRILPMGSRVNVVEVDGRRVRIDEPIGGWCSIESSNGDLILSPTTNDDEAGGGVANVGAADQGRAEALAKELQELKWLREEVAAKNMEEIHSKLEKSSSKLEDLKAKHNQLSEQVSESTQASHDRLADLNRRIRETQRLMTQVQAEQSNIHHEISAAANQYTPSKSNAEETALQNGDVILMQGGDMVIVRYCGTVHFDKGNRQWIGCELSDYNAEYHDGTVQGQSYFHCKKGYGKFVLKEHMKKKIPAEALLQMLQIKVEELHMETNSTGRE